MADRVAMPHDLFAVAQTACILLIVDYGALAGLHIRYVARLVAIAGMVRQLQGHLTIRSNDPKGPSFLLDLPILPINEK